MNHLVSLMTIRAEKQACLVSHLRYWALLLLTVGLLQATTAQAQTINTIAGNGTTTYNGEDENGADDKATAVSLYSPRKAAIDASGNVYIADSSHNRIRRVDKNGIITTVAGNGTASTDSQAPNGDGGLATSASLNYPTSVAIDSNNNLYIADNKNHRIRKVTASSGFISTVAGDGTQSTDSKAPNGDGGLATSAQLNTPASVAIDSSGTTLYIADKNNQRIRKVDKDGYITTVAGTGYAGYYGDGGVATSATLNFPFDVAVDTSGNLFIADTTNQLIRKVTASDGLISTVAGDGGKAFTGDGGAATEASLNNPAGIAVAANGDLYIADTTNQRIRQVLGSDGIINTVVGNGEKTFGGDGGAPINASLNNPYGITVDATGNLYIADTNNQRVRKVMPLRTYTSTTLISSPSTSTYGGSVTFTAAVTGSSSPPTGTVTFKDGSTTLCSAVQVDSATSPSKATCKTSALSVGSHSITATYNGDSKNASSTSAAVTQTVKAVTTTTVTSSKNPATYGESVTFTAAVTGSSSPPTGTVTFKDGSTTLCSAVQVDSATSPSKATCKTSALSVGSHSITATYNGDSYNASSTSAAVTQTVKAVTTTTVISSKNPATYGESVTFTAAVTGSSSPPTGTVTFKDGNTTLCSAVQVDSATSPSIATCTTSTLSVGSHSITATYNGDGNNASSTTTTAVTQTVKAVTSTTLISSPSTSTYGGSVTFTAAVTGSSSPPTGTVTFKDGSTTLCSAVQVDSATSPSKATCKTSALSVGSHSITATYNGDSYNASSTSNKVTQSVKYTTFTSLTSSASEMAYGNTVYFTATIQGVSPTGTVAFKDTQGSFSASCDAVVVQQYEQYGQATCSYSSFSQGSHTITAKYNGDTNNATSTSTEVSLTINAPGAATSMSVSSSVNPSMTGYPVTLTAALKCDSQEGTVQFTDGSNIIPGCETTPLTYLSGSSGGGGSMSTATCTTSTLSVGSHTINAVYSGDANEAMSSDDYTLQVNATSPIAIKLTSPSTGDEFPTSIQVNLVATASGGSAPIKQVDFYINNTKIGTVKTNSLDTVPPYTYTYLSSKLANGSYTLKAKATDYYGSSKTSDSVTIKVCYECDSF